MQKHKTYFLIITKSIFFSTRNYAPTFTNFTQPSPNLISYKSTLSSLIDTIYKHIGEVCATCEGILNFFKKNQKKYSLLNWVHYLHKFHHSLTLENKPHGPDSNS
jgi:hypothetical protein